jgi:hypothetical protein
MSVRIKLMLLTFCLKLDFPLILLSTYCLEQSLELLLL